ncbi:MAG: toxin-antitoxin system toxin component, PIN family protein, partial [Chloroflexi bacterium CG_4_10_14_0_8_um_filter_57_5]
MNIKRVVVDTNVLFEGLTRKGGAAGLVVDAWLAGLFRP